jgi:hypothetical protein
MKKCIICGSPQTSTDGFLIVVDKELVHRFGGVPGEDRAFGFSLCNACVNLPEHFRVNRIEMNIRELIDMTIDRAAKRNHGHWCRQHGRFADMLHVGLKGEVFGTCSGCRRLAVSA